MKIEKVNYEALNEFKDIVKGEYIYYSISFEHRIFGYLIFSKNDDLILERIYIKKEFRNSGYGSKLLNFSIHDNLENDFSNVVVLNHKRIDNFLEKNDFIKIDNKYIRMNIKEEIENINATIHVNKVSIVINIVLSLLKLIFGYIFSLNSLIADGINSFSDLINNILILIGSRIEKEPGDEDHPFGHGKVASIFSLIIGIIIIISSLDVLKSGILSLINVDEIEFGSNFMILIIILVILLMLKLLQYIYVNKFNKKYDNSLLNALIIDYKVDIVLSTSVIIGILTSKYLNDNIDSILSILITGYLILQGYNIVKENAMILMDSQDEKLLLNIKLLTLKVDGIKNIHDVYMTRIGEKIYIIADIRLDPSLTLEQAHEIAEIAEKKIKYRFSNIKRVIYHIEPNYNEDLD